MRCAYTRKPIYSTSETSETVSGQKRRACFQYKDRPSNVGAAGRLRLRHGL